MRSPFNNTLAGLAVAEKALDDDEFIEQCRNLNREQRNGLHSMLLKTNFIYLILKRILFLIEVPGNADDASEKLLQQGFIVRSGDALGTPGYIRVTIGYGRTE